MILLEHQKPLRLNLASPSSSLDSLQPLVLTLRAPDGPTGLSAEGQHRTLQKASTWPMSPCQGSHGDTLSDMIHRRHEYCLSPFIPKGAGSPPATLSAQFQLKTHTPVSQRECAVPCCSVFILKADSWDSHLLAECAILTSKRLSHGFRFLRSLPCEALTLAPSDTSK